MKIWVGDALIDPRQAHVSVLDHGFTVGDGVFETLKVIDGVPFALSRHLERLAVSAAGIGLPAPDVRRIRTAVEAVCLAPSSPLMRLRITWTGGAGPLGSDRTSAEPSLVVVAAPTSPWPATATVAMIPWWINENSPTVGFKTTSYAANVVALQRAHDMGADEALMQNTRGLLCEGTGSNVCVVVDGQLLTPRLSSGALPGITRGLVLQWCGAMEADLPFDILKSAEEILLTSSTRDLQPVSRVLWQDGHRDLIAPGAITREAMDAFAAGVATGMDP
jgi:branched-chain amino acid aminotransferase